MPWSTFRPERTQIRGSSGARRSTDARASQPSVLGRSGYVVSCGTPDTLGWVRNQSPHRRLGVEGSAMQQRKRRSLGTLLGVGASLVVAGSALGASWQTPVNISGSDFGRAADIVTLDAH